MCRSNRMRKFLYCMTAALTCLMLTACAAVSVNAGTGESGTGPARRPSPVFTEDQAEKSSIPNEDLADRKSAEQQEKTKVYRDDL